MVAAKRRKLFKDDENNLYGLYYSGIAYVEQNEKLINICSNT